MDVPVSCGPRAVPGPDPCCVVLQVLVPEAETRAGLTLKPQLFPLTVTDRPVMDVAFVQFLASVSGKVSCLGKM